MTTAAANNLPPPPAPTGRIRMPVAGALARDAFGREIPDPAQQTSDPQAGQPVIDPLGSANGNPPAKKESATDALGRRAGALSDEIDFPKFVASLLHGTFDAMVDASIRQMQAYGDLVSAVAKPLEQFTEENVSANQARDYLVEQHPRDVMLTQNNGDFQLAPLTAAKPASNGDDTSNDGAGDDAPPSPSWLADYGHAGAELTPELLENDILPAAREKVAKARLQTLATMVLMGLNRIVVKDGSVGARLRFRAAASDHAAVQYATGGDPPTGGEAWGQRASSSDPLPSTMVSTVGVNVQSDTDLKAELFGDVKINFASETLPLDRFVDDAQRTLLERHSRALPGVPPAPPVRLVPANTAPVATAPQIAPPPAPPAPVAPSSAPTAPPAGTPA